MVNNILEGLIWFWVPASLVICNDVFAYIWGISIGRTPLIKLSPKKTVEGFVGAFGSTLIFSVLWGTYFMQFKYMTCPVHDLGVSAFDSVDCVPNPVFVWREWKIWSPLASALSSAVCELRLIQSLSLTTKHSLDIQSQRSRMHLTRYTSCLCRVSHLLWRLLAGSLRQVSNEHST